MKAKAGINLIQNTRGKYHVVFFPYPSFFSVCLYPKIVSVEGAWIFLSVLPMKCPFILYVIFWLFRIFFNILAIRIVREFGMKRYTLSYLKWLPNKDSLYSAGNSAQCYVAARKGRKFGREWTRICVAESLCYSPETHNIVCLSPIPQYKIKSFFF